MPEVPVQIALPAAAKDRRWPKLFDAAAITLIFYLAAAASFSGYFGKWGFRDDEQNWGLTKVLDGSATRPWVYRQLLPLLTETILTVGQSVIPNRLQAAALKWLAEYPDLSTPDTTFSQAKTIKLPGMRARYLILYYLTFASFILTLFAMRRLCLQLGYAVAHATLAPLLFALIFPVLLTRGGYYYDAPETLFFVLSVLLAVQGRWPWLALIAAVATLNKESYLFFVPTLYPFLRLTQSRRRAIAVAVVVGSIALAANLMVKYYFQANPGVVAISQLRHHIRFFLTLAPYLRVEINYGVVTAGGINLLHVGLLFALWRATWPRLRPELKRHALIAASINAPLFAIFAYQDELRNLSLLFPTLLLMLAEWIKQWLGRSVVVSTEQD